MNELHANAWDDIESQLVEVDQRFTEELVNSTSIDEDDVRKIIKLHKAEMKEYSSKACVVISYM